MRIEWLEEFVLVASLQSITKAAAELNLTQPALSKHMRNLERCMGGELLARSNTNTTLTPLGEVLLSEIRVPLFDLTEELERTADARRARTGKIVVESYVPYKTIDGIIEAVKRGFVKDRILVTVELNNVGRRSPLESVRGGFADVAFMQLSSTSDLSGLKNDIVFRESMACVVPKGHLLAPEKSVPLSAINGHSVYFYKHPASQGHNDLIKELLLRNGIEFEEHCIPWDECSRDDRNYRFENGLLLEGKSHVEQDIAPHALRAYSVVDIAGGDLSLPMSIVWRQDEDDANVLQFVERALVEGKREHTR